MKKIIILLLMLTQFIAVEVTSEALSVEQQRDIVEMYQYVTGRRDQVPSALAELDENDRPPIRCGTLAILDFLDNYDRLDRRLLTSMGVEVGERPSLAFQYDAPLGMIRVHYATAGDDRVRDADIDLNGNGVPDYVEAVGRIADSVYMFTIDSLGYMPPLVDTTCNNGGDDRIDLYLQDLGSGIFGLTWPDTLCPLVSTNQSVPSWMELDNDYTDISAYRDRPLDAVRVTLAHEFFHMIHFTIDLTESREIFEMTATWMEEQQYDDINDYYSLMPFFFRLPRRSLQSQFNFHHYASVLFPIYLSESYGPDIVRHIWTRAGELGVGTHWLRATDEALDSASSGTESFATAVQEFAIWNYFTGEYSHQAPNGIGYSEKEFYPEIPVEEMLVVDSFPGILLNNENTMSPELNGVAYVRFENIQAINIPEYWRCDSATVDTLCHDSSWVIDTSYWVCDSGSFESTCYDSTEVIDTSLWVCDSFSLDSTCHDSTYIVDTFFNIFVSLSRNASNWGAVFLQQMENDFDSHAVSSTVIPGNGDLLIDLPGVDGYQTITMILTPTTTIASQYRNFPFQPFGYFLFDTSGATGPDPAFVDLPTTFLVPYPNPAIVPTMGSGAAASKGKNIWFRFQIPTDSEAELQFTTPLYRLDLYTIVGELVRTLEVEVFGVQADRENGPPMIEYETSWDMKNDQGEDVVSGVYLVYAHLYSDISRDNLLAEDRAKVVIIR